MAYCVRKMLLLEWQSFIVTLLSIPKCVPVTADLCTSFCGLKEDCYTNLADGGGKRMTGVNGSSTKDYKLCLTSRLARKTCRLLRAFSRHLAEFFPNMPVCLSVRRSLTEHISWKVGAIAWLHPRTTHTIPWRRCIFPSVTDGNKKSVLFNIWVSDLSGWPVMTTLKTLRVWLARSLVDEKCQ